MQCFIPDATRRNNDNCSYLSRSFPVRRKNGKDISRIKDIPLLHLAPSNPKKMTTFLEHEIIYLETGFQEKKLRREDFSCELAMFSETVQETENQHANEVENLQDKLELKNREQIDVEQNFFTSKDTNEVEFQLIQKVR